jgi:hypothetical protein
MYGMALLAILTATGVGLSASVNVAPEIDGGTLATGLGLVTAGVLVLRARRGK